MSWLELLAAILGAISVWLVVKRNIWAFPIGIAMVIIYAWIFYEAKLYSDVLLQVFFAIMQVQGWIHWQQSNKGEDHLIQVRKMNRRQWIFSGLAQLGGTLGLGYGMKTFTDAALPWLDAFAAVQSMLAQWWMNKRYLDNWILWVAVDVLYLYIYSSRGLYFTTVLYGIFLIMAVTGYIEWRKKIR